MTMIWPTMGMVAAECAQVGLTMIEKAAMSRGMSNFVFVFVFYSNALASLVLLPLSLLFHRFLAQVFGYAGINCILPRLVLRCLTWFRLLLSYWLFYSGLDLRKPCSLAKSAGTIVSVAGAVMPNWVMGGVLLSADCVMILAWVILQASILKKYPAELIIVFFYCFFVAIQSAIVSLIVEGLSSAWRLDDNLRLYSVLYLGVFGSAFQVGIATWCLHKTGPLFVSMFMPLGIIIASIAGILFFGETFYLGCLLGAIAIAVGFYFVMWGKAREVKLDGTTSSAIAQTNSQKVPLLEPILEEDW